MRLGLAFINAGTQRKAIRAGGGEYFSENSSASGRSPTRAEFHTFQRLPKHGLVGPQSRLCPGLRAGMFHVASRWWHCTIGGITAHRSCTARGDAQARSSKLCTSQPGFMGKCHISHSFPPLCFAPWLQTFLPSQREKMPGSWLPPSRPGPPQPLPVPTQPVPSRDPMGPTGASTSRQIYWARSAGPQGSVGHDVWVAQGDVAPRLPGPPGPYVGCGVHPSAVTPELPRGGAPEVARGRRERGEADRIKITELAGAGSASCETAPSHYFTGETAAVG